MSFDTLTFWVFFPLVWVAWRRLPFGSAKTFAVVASFAFYGWWNPLYLPLLLVSAGTDYVVGGRIHDSSQARSRRRWLFVSLALNLGLLAGFKYAPLAARSIGALGRWIPLDWDWELAGWVVPVGISFYTFQTLSYTLDIYRGHIQPCRSFRDFLLYVSFFPQLVAGPIVRARRLLPQLESRRRLRASAVQLGLYRVIWGLAMKIVVADNLAPAVERAFAPETVARLEPARAWLGALYFHVQIFADFAGYSSIAIGLALLLGLSFPENFRSPYLAVGAADFWGRWHRTLSTWLRDYLYVPLGGNRKGRRRTLINLLLVMTLGGLWHGAAWTFVAWGLVHGVALCVERALPLDRRPGRPEDPATALFLLLRMALFTAFLLVTWVLFRAQDFELAATYLGRMFIAPFQVGFTSGPVEDWRYLVLVLPVLGVHVFQLGHEWLGWRKTATRRAILAGMFLFLLTVIDRGRGAEFIYFQF